MNNENELTPEQRATLESLGVISPTSVVTINHDASSGELQNVSVAAEVPPQTVEDLSAHMDVRELNDEQRDNKLAELEARISALETTVADALKNVADYVVQEFAKLETASHSDVEKVVAFVKTLVHPSQWEKL